MREYKVQRYAMFGMLYFAQGAILSYFTALNAIYLLSFGLSMTQIGIISATAMLPLILKIFLGMLSDRVNLFKLGYRKPYIIIGLFIQAGCLLVVPGIHPYQQYELFAALAFLLMTGMALYDTCTDGLALDTTAESEQGTIQGIMVGGRALGVVVISSVIGLLVQRFSWEAAFWLLAALTLLPLPLVLAMREAPRTDERKFEWRAFAAFNRRPVIALAGLGALYSLIINAANEIVNPFMQSEFGIGVFTAGLFTTVWGLGTIAGGLTGGRMTDHIGQRKSVLAAIAIATVSILGLAVIYSPSIAWPLVILFGLAFGYYETVYFAISMRATDPRIAASMFSILMAIANAGTGVGLAVGGLLVDSLGYRWTFLIIAGLNLLALPLLSTIFQLKPDRHPTVARSL
jgi:MFS transporter, PAT family, beta-lactamase induction signal transducer AmpG